MNKTILDLINKFNSLGPLNNICILFSTLHSLCFFSVCWMILKSLWKIWYHSRKKHSTNSLPLNGFSILMTQESHRLFIPLSLDLLHLLCKYVLISSSHFISVPAIVYLSVCQCARACHMYIWYFNLYRYLPIKSMHMLRRMWTNLTFVKPSFEWACGVQSSFGKFVYLQQPDWISLAMNISSMKLHWRSLEALQTLGSGSGWLRTKERWVTLGWDLEPES